MVELLTEVEVCVTVEVEACWLDEKTTYATPTAKTTAITTATTVMIDDTPRRA
jgi:hypothetical protein